MKTFLAIGLLFLAGQTSFSQLSPLPIGGVMRSASGQFVILDRRGAPAAGRPPVAPDPSLLELEPPLLVVSCERIKQALCAELDASRDWTSRVTVTLRPGGSVGDNIQIAKEPAGRGWNYRLDVPHYIDRTKFIRAIVRVLLQEMADRTQSDHDAEIPAWLSEGITQHLLASRDAELILPPPSHRLGSLTIAPTTIVVRDPDPLETTRRVLRSAPTPTLEQLNWFDPNTLDSTEGDLFRHSSQLFVSELMKLTDGKKNLRATIAEFATCYNWQTAFLRAYKNQFANQLALEKWWALQASYFAGRDNRQHWTNEESSTKLDGLLRARVAIQISGTATSRADVSLQVVIREWDSIRQNITLKEKIYELEQARTRIAPDYIPMVEDYRTTLATYLKKREKAGATFLGIRTSASAQVVVAETVQLLDALDTQRALLSALLANVSKK